MNLRAKLIVGILVVVILNSSSYPCPAGMINYTYDNAGRLTKTDYGGGKSIEYTYDNNGNLLQRRILTSYTPGESRTFIRTIEGGNWTLISLPVQPTDGNPINIFGTALLGIYGWDDVLEMYYVPQTLQAKIGYWVALADLKQIQVLGTVPLTTQAHLGVGWNLVGPVGNQPEPTGPTILAVYGWGWPPDYRYVVPTTAEEGKGYWIAVSSETDIW